MAKFEVGKVYRMRSIGDQNCTWDYKVVSRTQSTITLQETDGSAVKTCRINARATEIFGCEAVKPLGRYAFSPSLRADKEVANA